MYRLKATSAAFEIVDGPFAGRKYLRGKTYAEIPPQEKDKFETVKTSAGKAEAAITETLSSAAQAGAGPTEKRKEVRKSEKYLSKL